MLKNKHLKKKKRISIYLSGVVLDTQWPGVLEWKLLDLSSSPKILLLYLIRQTVQWYMH